MAPFCTSASDANKNDDITPELTPELVIQRPLQSTWTLWSIANDGNKTWEENLTEVTTFDTFEEFWSVYLNAPLPSELDQGSCAAFFKQGLRPVQGDQAHSDGGRWRMHLQSSDLDFFWMNMMLLLTGEGYDHASDVCGALARPSGNTIDIWISDAAKKAAIGRKLREQLQIHAVQACVFFQVHP